MSATCAPVSDNTRPRRRLLSLLVAQALSIPAATQAATIVVDSTTDDGTGCTLREAIESVNNAALEPGCSSSGFAFGTEDTVAFGPAVEGQTITLTGGALFIEASVAINPGGTSMTTVDANLQSQGFIVSFPVTVTMNRLAVNNGKPGTIAVSGGGISLGGGANLVLQECSFTNNQASTAASGGAVSLFRAGYLTVVDSTFAGNSGFDQGGGISVRQSGNVTITGSTFESNVASTAGAVAVTGSVNQVEIDDSAFRNNASQGGSTAILFKNNGSAILRDSVVSGNTGVGAAVYGYLADSLEITGATISNNTGGQGGGVFARFSPLTITASTISGNSATAYGAGVTAKASSRQSPYGVVIENTTLSGNFTTEPTGDFPSALYLGRLESGLLRNVTITGNDIQGPGSAALQVYLLDSAVISNTIVANTPGAPDCTVAFTTSISIGSDSIIENNSCGGTPTVTDPLLLPLADNGGPTPTHAPGIGSPAIDAGDNAACTATDQRGFPRPADGDGDTSAICDIGAIESGAGNQPPAAVDDSVTTRRNIPITFDVAANDTDTNGNLDVTTTNTDCGACSGPVNGSLANNGDGTFEFTPALDFVGSDAFIYEICDSDGACDTANVGITVEPPSADTGIELVLCSDRSAPAADYAYGLRVSNAGPDAAEGVAVTHTPIAGASVSSISDPNCLDTGASIDCDLGTLASGTEVLIGVLIQTPDAGAQSLSMSADIAASTGDSGPADNTDDATLELVPGLVGADGFESCTP